MNLLFPFLPMSHFCSLNYISLALNCFNYHIRKPHNNAKHKGRSMSLIREKAVELCQVIASDEQFIKFQKIVDNFINDKEINSDYQSLLELQRELNIKKIEGKLTQPEIDEFDRKCDEVFSQSAVAEFLEAQDALDQLLDMLNRYVELTFEFGRVPTEKEVDEEARAEEELAEQHEHDCSCC